MEVPGTQLSGGKDALARPPFVFVLFFFWLGGYSFPFPEHEFPLFFFGLFVSILLGFLCISYGSFLAALFLFVSGVAKSIRVDPFGGGWGGGTRFSFFLSFFLSSFFL